MKTAPTLFPQGLGKHIHSLPGFDMKNTVWSTVSGGSIHMAYRLQCGTTSAFIKLNKGTKYAQMFEREERGLKLLREAQCLAVPGELGRGNFEDWCYLALEWIESSAPDRQFWIDFGTGLAQLHQIEAVTFGLDHHNFMGELPQSNQQNTEWIGFFINQRLLPQIKLARENDRLPREHERKFQGLISKLDELLVVERPALLHGDLWGGNFLSTLQGAYLIDPACYYGHREVDIAMTTLFGGFSTEFYESYQNVLPLEPGYAERLKIYNLYPLLIHLNLFGRSYLSSISQTLNRFV